MISDMDCGMNFYTGKTKALIQRVFLTHIYRQYTVYARGPKKLFHLSNIQVIRLKGNS